MIRGRRFLLSLTFMTRHHYQVGKPYAGKLIRVAARPIENDPSLSVHLLRLEFAVYRMADQDTLESQGEIACRDLIVGRLIPAQRDAGLIAYAQALRLTASVDDPASWLNLERQGRWIELTFGPAESEGGRNPFASIQPFDPVKYAINEYRYDRSAKWVTIGAAADAVGVSESTVRRRVDAMEDEWGSDLVRRTEGEHRRIFLPLFTNVWKD